MTERLEYDFDHTANRPRRAHIDVTIRHHRGPNLLPAFVAVDAAPRESESMVQALGLRLVVEEDPEMCDRLRDRWTPREILRTNKPQPASPAAP
jgi:hypothetical protein